MAEADETIREPGVTLRSFMRHLAHELGNPVASIRMSGEMLLGDYPAEMHQELFQIIMSEALRLETLIESAVYFCSIAPPNPQEVELASIIQSALRQGEAPIQLDLQTDLACDTINADPGELTRTLREIFLNAEQAEATTLTVAARPDGDDVVITVTDNGQGVPAAKLPKLLEPFYTMREGHLGLGLCIAKRIVDLHHGTIDIGPAAARGMMVTVRFPQSSR